jgi:WD40 repeat protein
VKRHPGPRRTSLRTLAHGLLAGCAITAVSTAESQQDQRASVQSVQVEMQTGHAGMITSVALSADGRYVLSSSMDQTARLWDVAGGQEQRTFTGLDVFPDARFVSGTDRAILGASYAEQRVIDLTTGRTVRAFGGTRSEGVVSSNGRFAVVKDVQTGIVNVIDLALDKTVATLQEHASLTPYGVSDDGRLLLVSRVDVGMGRAMLRSMINRQASLPTAQYEMWDLTTGAVRNKLLQAQTVYGQDRIHVLSPDGALLVVNRDNGLRFYDTTSGEEKLNIPVDKLDEMRILFSADSRMLVGQSANAARIWEIPSGRLVTTLDAASAVNFSPDGRSLVLARWNSSTPILRDLETGRESPLSGGVSSIADLALVYDGRAVIAGTDMRGANYWDLKTGHLIRTFKCEGEDQGVRSVSASSTRPLLATACGDGRVLLWNFRTGALLRTVNQTKPSTLGGPMRVRFDTKGRLLAMTVNEELVVWDVAAERETLRITLPRPPSLWSTIMSSMAGGGTAMPMPKGLLERLPEDVREQMIHPAVDPSTDAMMNAVYAIAFHPDSKRLAVAMGTAVILVDASTGEVLRQFTSAGTQTPEPQTEQEALMEKLMSGATLSRKDYKALAKAQKQGRMPMQAMVRNPSIDDMMGSMDLARALVFSADGQTLVALGNRQRVWEVETGRKLGKVAPKWIDASQADAYSELAETQFDPDVGLSAGVAMSPDSRVLARAKGNRIVLSDVATEAELGELSGHVSAVTTLVWSANGQMIVSGSRDGTVRVWNVQDRSEVVQLIALGSNDGPSRDYVAVTPDQFYRASRRRVDGVAFRVNDQLYPFEQFDLRFNRPDVIVERLGGEPETVRTLRAAYERRLKKLALTESELSADVHLPEVSLAGEALPVSTAASTLALRVRARDEKYPLDRINVFVNDVPVFGTAGLSIPDREARAHEQNIQVPLVPGRNKLQVSVLNQQGAESLRQTVYTTSTSEPAPPDVYIVAIGVSKYRNAAYDLRFASKDARDLVDTYRAAATREGAQGQVHVLDLTDERATREGIRQAREWLKQARANDLVLVFAAGHGMTDDRQNYYFGTYDVDKENPSVNGLPYEDFEGLLDGIAALKKVLLIDTCFSGEIEKDEPTVVAPADTGGAGTVSVRAFKPARGSEGTADDSAPRATGERTGNVDVVRFQQELFADLRRGTGAVVISSASGSEYALEGPQWSNGVFTYALLNGLKNGRADANKDARVTVSELQVYVLEEVRKLTTGGQNPTVRRENLDYDFAVF